MTTEADIRKIVSEVMQRALCEVVGSLNSDVVLDEDFDGDKIVRVTAHFNRRPRGTAPSPCLTRRDAIRARLIEAGDDRFVFVSRDYPGASDERQLGGGSRNGRLIVMTMVERLLALAEELAEKSGRGLTLKRRAVSTAYYAVFHALAGLCADELLGGRIDRAFPGIYPGLSLSGTRDAQNRVQRRAPEPCGTIAEDWKQRCRASERANSLGLPPVASPVYQGRMPRPR